jgi:SAM-dependent methyltransferase
MARVALDELVQHEETGVLVLPAAGTAATYLDGAEQYLLDVLRSVEDVSVFSSELRAHVRDWASLYHLTPYRATILDALGLSAPDPRVLELGAGCGAVTRWLGERFAHVDTVEGSLARAVVARERCRDLPGVRVTAANFFDLDFTGRFDLTTLIGVLEYSHLYHPEHQGDPARAALSNLELARASLRDDGLLVIAIENKFGLKYLSGCHEDHSSRRFDGIEGYPTRSSAVTFSAVELERLVLAAGFSGADFYLPFPDYKLARTVFDASLADESTYPANWVETPFPDRAGSRGEALFDESLVLREMVPAGLLRGLANSFVVLAYNGEREKVRARLGVEGGWVARHYSLDRRPGFCKRTSLEAVDGELVVRNTPAVLGAEPTVVTGLVQHLEDEPFRRGHQALFELLEHHAAGRLSTQLPALVARMNDFLLRDYGVGSLDVAGFPLLRGDALDAIWWNVVVDPATGEWQAIDGEWRFEGLLPVDYVLWRGFYHVAGRFAGLMTDAGAGDPAAFAAAAIRNLFPHVSPDRLALHEELERFVQRAAGADPLPPETELLSPRVRELLGLAGDETFHVLAFAEELADHPSLLATFAEAFGAGERATLVAYAPDIDPSAIALRLETLLAEGPATDPDVMLVAVPREAAAEARLARSVGAVLSGVVAGEPFAGLPHVGAGDSARLRELALAASVVAS